jgi:hypothetical protein
VVVCVDASVAYQGLTQPLAHGCEVLQELPEWAFWGHLLDIVCTVATVPYVSLSQQCLAPRHLGLVPFDIAGQDPGSRLPEQW